MPEALSIKSQQHDLPTLAGQRQEQWTGQSGWGKDHNASTLYRKLQATGGCWEQEKYSSAGKSTLTGCSIPNGQH